jgi:hypothetical protein
MNYIILKKIITYPPIEIPVAARGIPGCKDFTCLTTSDRSSKFAALYVRGVYNKQPTDLANIYN